MVQRRGERHLGERVCERLVATSPASRVGDTLFSPPNTPDDTPNKAAQTGPPYFSKTTERGKTGSQAKVIFVSKTRQQTIGNIIVVGPDGTLYDFTDLIIPPNT